MKKLIISVLALFAAQALYADEIILKDGSILKGTIIQVTDTAVEYDPDGPPAFDTVSRDSVIKIIYPDGREQAFLLDTIVLTSGEAIKCSIIRVTKESVIYRQGGTGEEKSISRDQVARLDFSDGKSVDIWKKETPGAPEEPAKKPVGGYHSSIFRLSIFGGGGIMEDGTIMKEQHVFKAYKPDLIMANMNAHDYYQYTGFGTVGVEMDLMPPAIRFPQKRGFDFTGIKFGIRGRYGYESATSVITPEYGNGYYDYYGDAFSGRLMEYHYWAVGPVINFIFSPRSNVTNFMISVYGMGGQVFSGHLSPMTSLRDSELLMARLAGAWNPMGTPVYMSWANPYTPSQLNNTAFSGYTIRCGIGPEFSLNKYFPLVIGLHFTYAYTSLTYDRAPLIYMDGNRKAAHHEFGGEVSVGVHI